MRLSLILLILLGLAGSASAQQLEVRIEGIQSIAGNLRIAIFDQGEHFPDHPFARTKKEVKVTSHSQSITFSNLPKGRYAIAVYHDENADATLNKNYLGIPTEYYGFSRDARARFGPPAFSDSAIQYDGRNQSTIIRLR